MSRGKSRGSSSRAAVVLSGSKHVYFSPGGRSYTKKTKSGRYQKMMKSPMRRRSGSVGSQKMVKSRARRRSDSVGAEWRGKHVKF